jgi:hypothetical protein
MVRILEYIGLSAPFRFDHSFLALPLAALAILFALWRPALAQRCALSGQRLLDAFARKPWLAAGSIVILAVIAGAVQLAARGVPVPRVHDEFSYLLGADTFAHGRLTNPPPPLWIHFETFHVIQQPTYASMYPPAQGLFMATGEWLFNLPWAGVWISAALLGLASLWSLQGWFPRRWAFVGALFVTTTACCSYWLDTYWGGSVAAIGGALVLGAWPRLERRPSVRDSLLFGLGMAILANSRMYEGGVLSLIAVALLTFSAIRKPVALPSIYWRHSVLPAGLLLAATGAWMMYYNWRVTGHPFLLPYVLNMKTYLSYGIFLWQRDPPQPSYRHDVMRQLYTLDYKFDRANLLSFWYGTPEIIQQFMGTMLVVPLCALPWIVRSRRIRGLLLATVGVALAVLLLRNMRPHYLAPATIGIVGLTVQALRYLSITRIGTVAAQTLIFVWLGSQWGSRVGGLLIPPPAPDWAVARDRMERNLVQTGERHLIIVRYSSSHARNQEWVYNDADLAASPVIWAREMRPADDRTLVEYFKDRKIWLLEADSARLVPFDRTQ